MVYTLKPGLGRCNTGTRKMANKFSTRKANIKFTYTHGGFDICMIKQCVEKLLKSPLSPDENN